MALYLFIWRLPHNLESIKTMKKGMNDANSVAIRKQIYAFKRMNIVWGLIDLIAIPLLFIPVALSVYRLIILFGNPNFRLSKGHHWAGLLLDQFIALLYDIPYLLMMVPITLSVI